MIRRLSRRECRLWFLWSVFSSLSVLLGFAVAVVPAFLLAFRLDIPGSVLPPFQANEAAKNLLAGAILGSCIGGAVGIVQERLLRGRFPELRGRWLIATLVGWTIVVALVYWFTYAPLRSQVPSLIRWLSPNPNTFNFPVPVLILGLAVSGLQAIALRSCRVQGAAWWLLAGLGWSAIALLLSRFTPIQEPNTNTGVSFTIMNAISGWFLLQFRIKNGVSSNTYPIQ